MAGHHNQIGAGGYGELIRLTGGCKLALPCYGNYSRSRSLPIMTEHPAGLTRQPRFSKARAATLGFGLGAALAVSPLVWAQNAPAGRDQGPLSAGAPLLSQQSFAPLVKRVLPAVVNISVTEKSGFEMMSDQVPERFRGSPFEDFMRRFFDQEGRGRSVPSPFSDGPGGDENQKRIALGSGFIIDPSGYVVTNSHVVGEAAKVEVVLQDNSKYPAKIVGRDQRTDLALLKIKADKPLPYVAFGDSSAAQVGDWVVAVGNPFGLGGSVTTGIVSARGRDIRAGQFDDFLQIDAPINRGNSGGPTFNLAGEVIGINTAIYSPNGGSVGIGFAVPANVAKTVVGQLQNKGKVSRGWLGVQIQPMTAAIAGSLGLKSEQGALVASVTQNSPAAKAGVKQGDVILSFDGKDVKEQRDLPRLVAAAEPDTASMLTVWRQGKTTDLRVTLGEAPESPRMASAGGDRSERSTDEQRADAMGMHFAPLTQETRRQLRVGRDVRGVVITAIDDGSPADSIGVIRGDVLVSVNQEPVTSPDDAAQKLKQAASGNGNALLLLNRQGVDRYVGVRLGKDAG